MIPPALLAALRRRPRTPALRRVGAWALRGAAFGVSLAASLALAAHVAVSTGTLRLDPYGPSLQAAIDARPSRSHAAAARASFLPAPPRYIPAAAGADPVLLTRAGLPTPGRAEFAVLYAGRLYLFAAKQTRSAFAADPGAFLGE